MPLSSLIKGTLRSQVLDVAPPHCEAVAKSIKALNHKDTKAQRKTFLPAGRSLSQPGRNFVFSCLCGSILLEAFATPSLLGDLLMSITKMNKGYVVTNLSIYSSPIDLTKSSRTLLSIYISLSCDKGKILIQKDKPIILLKNDSRRQVKILFYSLRG